MAMTRLMTADDLAHMPEDGNQYILVKGELIRLSPNNYRHAQIMFWIGWHFLNYADGHGGEVTGADSGFILHVDPDTVLAPDVAYIRPDRIPPDSAKDGYSEVVPDIVVEIVSPSDRPGLQRRKIAEYLTAGVRLVVYVDPRSRTIAVHSPDGTRVELAEEDIFDGLDAMPGFQLTVAKFFER
jgi:Uma2 family endonuclease